MPDAIFSLLTGSVSSSKKSKRCLLENIQCPLHCCSGECQLFYFLIIVCLNYGHKNGNFIKL